jgi:hypothetical protein
MKTFTLHVLVRFHVKHYFEDKAPCGRVACFILVRSLWFVGYQCQLVYSHTHPILIIHHIASQVKASPPIA